MKLKPPTPLELAQLARTFMIEGVSDEAAVRAALKLWAKSAEEIGEAWETAPYASGNEARRVYWGIREREREDDAREREREAIGPLDPDEISTAEALAWLGKTAKHTRDQLKSEAIFRREWKELMSDETVKPATLRTFLERREERRRKLDAVRKRKGRS